MIVIIFLLAVLSSYVFAQEITGAFGIKFGQELKSLKVVRKSETTSGEPLYVIEPPKALKLLSSYVVGITPVSGKVYTIWGIESGLPGEECRSRMQAIAKAIEKKYKIKRKTITFAFAQDGYYFTKGQKRIVVKCVDTFMSGHDLYVQYFDEKLEEQAEKESIKLKSKEIDESGL